MFLFYIVPESGLFAVFISPPSDDSLFRKRVWQISIIFASIIAATWLDQYLMADPDRMGILVSIFKPLIIQSQVDLRFFLK